MKGHYYFQKAMGEGLAFYLYETKMDREGDAGTLLF